MLRDQLVRSTQDPLGAAVVLLQSHDLDVAEVPLELQDVADRRAPPAINRLVGIAGHRQVGIVDRQGPDNGVLSQIGVLVLVDQDVAEPLVERLAQFGVVTQHHGDVQQQIVEVDGVGLQQTSLVVRVNLPDDGSHGLGPGRPILFGRNQVVLGPTDRRRDARRRFVNQLDLRIVERRLEQLLAILDVNDREVLVQADQRRVTSQQACTEAMKCPQPDAIVRDQSVQPRAHLVGRLVGEGQRDDLMIGNPLLQQIGNAMRHDARLTAARPGQNQQGTVNVSYRLLLGISQGRQNPVRVCVRLVGGH